VARALFFETVFSDPVGDKVAFLEEAARCGYVVVLCYIGLTGPDQSMQRVAIRRGRVPGEVHIAGAVYGNVVSATGRLVSAVAAEIS